MTCLGQNILFDLLVRQAAPVAKREDGCCQHFTVIVLNTGGRIGGVITYALKGKQYVAATSAALKAKVLAPGATTVNCPIVSLGLRGLWVTLRKKMNLVSARALTLNRGPTIF